MVPSLKAFGLAEFSEGQKNTGQSHSHPARCGQPQTPLCPAAQVGPGGFHGGGKPSTGLWSPHQMVGWLEGGREQGRTPGQLPMADMPTPPTSASP